MGAVAKHCAGDVKQPIADRAEGTRVAVSAEAQSGVLGAAARIVLHGNAFVAQQPRGIIKSCQIESCAQLKTARLLLLRDGEGREERILGRRPGARFNKISP